MKKFFGNVWTKRVVSVVSVLYAVAVCFLCYYSIFYDIHIRSRASLCLLLCGVSVFALLFMLYTRKQLLTRISSFVILPAMLPVVLLYFGEWGLIIPIIVTGLLILLLSGAGEGAKTALGTVILLLYIFGALGYFLFTSFFVVSAKETVVETGISPSGKYRYRIVNTEDSSKGSTAVYVEPNDADVFFPKDSASPLVTFTLKNMERVVALDRPMCETISVTWQNSTRQQISSELNAISSNISVHLSEEELKELGYTYDSKLEISDVNVYKLMEIGRTASDVEPMLLDSLSDTQLAAFGIARDNAKRYYIISPSEELLDYLGKSASERIFFSDLDSKGFKYYNDYDACDIYGASLFTVSKDDSVLLSSLSDAQLAALGIPESGDVMIFNGKVVFRYYVSELENYFDTESRKFSISLLT
jgi:hypothetical protein